MQDRPKIIIEKIFYQCCILELRYTPWPLTLGSLAHGPWLPGPWSLAPGPNLGRLKKIHKYV